MDSISTAAYESKVAINRYMTILTIIPLIMFLMWWVSDLTSGAFYFLATVIAFLGFTVTRAWFAEREYFGRVGPIDNVTEIRKTNAILNRK